MARSCNTSVTTSNVRHRAVTSRTSIAITRSRANPLSCGGTPVPGADDSDLVQHQSEAFTLRAQMGTVNNTTEDAPFVGDVLQARDNERVGSPHNAPLEWTASCERRTACWLVSSRY